MSKQTAVEWLRDEIQSKYDKSFIEFYRAEITQALAMEREQIEEAYGDGINAHRVDFCNRNEYYQRTYGKEAGHE